MKNQNIQFKRTTPPLRMVGSLLCALLVSLAALTARAQTATVINPQGDAFYSNGRYGGFIVRVYFDGQLQDSRASPPHLLTLFPETQSVPSPNAAPNLQP